MKRYNDTYACLGAPYVRLHTEAARAVADRRARETLMLLAQASGTVKDVDFYPLDGAAHATLLGIFEGCEAPHGDAYAVHVGEERVSVYASSDNARRYALVSLVTHATEQGVPTGWIYNVPLCDFRSIKIYVPAREQLPFFERLMHMCMTFGLNTCVIEVGGAMEYERHPEINEGWERYCDVFREYNGKTMDANCTPPFGRNSIHCENGGGSYLTKAEMRALVEMAESYGIELIPELPSLSHADYILASHPEFAEMKDDPIPCCYCPSEPGVYELVFDLLDEVIEVFHPRTVHVAHDEWRAYGRCDKCRGKDPARMFADDLIKYYEYLKARGIQTMFWGDAMINCFGTDGEFHPGAQTKIRYTPTDRTVTIYGEEYPVYREHWDFHADEVADVPGSVLFELAALYPSIDMIPKDISVMNWYHTLDPSSDDVYRAHGFLDTVYGNFMPVAFRHWFARMQKGGIRGASLSNWSATERAHMQHRAFFLDLAYMSEMLWSRAFDEDDRLRNVRRAADALYAYRRTFEGNAEHAVTLTYTADTVIQYPGVWDGMQVDPALFRLGYLVVEYADGTSERKDIFWGEHVGPSTPLTATGFRPCAEAMYVCGLEESEDTVWYRTFFPLEREAVAAHVEPLREGVLRVRQITVS